MPDNNSCGTGPTTFRDAVHVRSGEENCSFTFCKACRESERKKPNDCWRDLEAWNASFAPPNRNSNWSRALEKKSREAPAGFWKGTRPELQCEAQRFHGPEACVKAAWGFPVTGVGLECRLCAARR